MTDPWTTPLIDVTAARHLLAAAEGMRTVAALDVRWSLTGPPGRLEYEQGHVPGARFVDLDTDLADPPSERGRHPLPEPGRFVAAMRGLGIDDETRVIAYDAADGTSAARLWWLLRHYGHDEVAVLDGGFRAWLDAGGAVERGQGPAPTGDTGGDSTAGTFLGSPGATAVLDADAAAALTGTGLLLDARAEERYRGEVEPVDPVAGHVPGARSAPTSGNVRPDGRFRSSAELRERFAGLGVRPGVPVGVYCGSGVTAAHEVLALELAGVPAALYPGSWSEWVRQGRPVETGPVAGTSVAGST